MAALIKDASVETVLATADIVDVVSGYTSLRKRGSTYTGLCPFHDEKTPSFSVSADKGLFYCFGCGEGGDVVSFLQKMDNLSFAESIEHLAERFSVPLEYEQGAVDEGRRDRERRLEDLVEKAARYYERYLWEAEEAQGARDYLVSRGLGRDVCTEYRLGFAPDDWHRLHHKARSQGFSDEELEAAGLLVRRDGKAYDRFRGRVMFPLIDHRGRVLGFGGRILGDGQPKYLNSPEGPLYRKGHLLYGLFQGRRAIGEAGEVVVVEGYTDVLALAQAGVRYAVASMGTALTSRQLRLISRFTNDVTFMFDADQAGGQAALRSGDLAREAGMRPMVVSLPQDADPADAVQGKSSGEVRELVARKVSLLRFEIRRALEDGDTSSAEGRVRAFERVRAILRKASSPKETEEEMGLIADRLQLSRDNVELLLREARSGGRQGGRRPRVGPDVGPGSSSATRMLGQDAFLEREFLAAAVSHPEIAVGVLDALTGEHFTDSVHREVFVALRSALTADDPRAAVTDLADGRTEAGRLFVRLAMEADEGTYSAAVLNEMHLRLQERHLSRAISLLRGRLADGHVDTEEEYRLFDLERLQQQVRAALADLEEEG